MSYFDMSNSSDAVDELLMEIKTAHPGLRDMVAGFVANNLTSFAKSGLVGASSSPLVSPKNAVDGKGDRALSPTPHALTKGASEASGLEDSSSRNRSNTPSRRDVKSRQHLGADLSGSGVPPALAYSDHKHPMSSSSIVSSNVPLSIGSKAVSRSRSPPHSPMISPSGALAMSPASAGGLSIGGAGGIHPSLLFSIGAPEMPDLDILAAQLSLADWTVLSQCHISDFMNASYLPKKKKSAAAIQKEAEKAAAEAKERERSDLLASSSDREGRDKPLAASAKDASAISKAYLSDDKLSSSSSSSLMEGKSTTPSKKTKLEREKEKGGAGNTTPNASAEEPFVPPTAYNSVARYIEHTNMTTRWIASKIMHTTSHRVRGKLLAYFVRLMELMKDRADYTGMMNIFTTLNTNSIWKLRKSWKYVDNKRGKTFSRFEAMIKPMSNFSGYRDMLNHTKVPAVPALAILTKDMVAIEEMPTFALDDDDNPTNYLNWFKFVQISAVLTEQFIRFIKTGYDTEPLPGLFDELMNPLTIILQNAATDSMSPLALLSMQSNFLMTDEEIATTADRLDMEEQGFSPVPNPKGSLAGGIGAGGSSPPSTSRGPPPIERTAAGASAADSKVGPLLLYLQSQSLAGPVGGSSGLRRSNAQGALVPGTLMKAALSATGLDSKIASVVTLDDSLDKISSVSLLRRILTQNLFNTHLMAETMSEGQKRAFENQPILHQRDAYIRMLRLVDVCVKHANANVYGQWNATMNSTMQAARTTSLGRPGILERSGSSQLMQIDPAGIKFSGAPEMLAAIFDQDIHMLELPNPHAHLMEVLAETVRIFQKFDGTTKYRNVMKPAQLQSTSGIGQSLLLENRGVLAEMSLCTRGLIHAFIAAASHYYSELAPSPSSSVASLTSNLFFNCVASIERVGITVQLSVSNTEFALPKAMTSMPEPDGGKAFVQRILSTLPPALAELLLPFESLLGSTNSSLLWVPKSSPDDPSSGAAPLLGSKKDKHASSANMSASGAGFGESGERSGSGRFAPPGSRASVDLTAGDDGGDASGSTSHSASSSNSSRQLQAQSTAAASNPATGGSALVLSMTLPLGSYASTLTYVSPSQKRYLASKLTSLEVSAWKVEHVVTWLYLTGMSHWCLKFEQQSISGAELSDLDRSDLEGMGVKPTSPAVRRRDSMDGLPVGGSGQSAAAALECALLLKSIKNLIRNDMWDGVVVAEASDAIYSAGGPSTPGNLSSNDLGHFGRSGTPSSTGGGSHGGHGGHGSHGHAHSHHERNASSSSIEDLIIGIDTSSESDSDNDSDPGSGEDLRSRDADSSSGLDEFGELDADDEGFAGRHGRNRGGSSTVSPTSNRKNSSKLSRLTAPPANFFGSTTNGSLSPQQSARSGSGAGSLSGGGLAFGGGNGGAMSLPNSGGIGISSSVSSPTSASGLGSSSGMGSPASSPPAREMMFGSGTPPGYGFAGGSGAPGSQKRSKRQSSSRSGSATLTGSAPSSSSKRGGSSTMRPNPYYSGLARLRVLGGVRAGIISFASQQEFTLHTFLSKLNALWHPNVPYAEDNAYITYYDMHGECVGLSSSQSFESCSTQIYHELLTEGALDVAYATITPKTDSDLGLSSSVIAATAAAAAQAAMMAGGSGSGLPSRTGSFSVASTHSLPDLPNVVDYAHKYKDLDDCKTMLILDGTGRIDWATKHCRVTITTDPLHGRNVDHLMPENMFEIAKQFSSGEAFTNVETWVATDTGAQICQVQFTPIAGSSPAMYECTIEFLETSDAQPWTKPVDIPKMREAASRSNASIIAYSQLYGLVQYCNRPSLSLLGSESLQGVKIASVFPFGSPTLPGEHSLPVQKKDGSLSVHSFKLKTYTTSSTDKLIVLTSAKI